MLRVGPSCSLRNSSPSRNARGGFEKACRRAHAWPGGARGRTQPRAPKICKRAVVVMFLCLGLAANTCPSRRGPMGGTNETACPAHYLALRTLKASRQLWLLLRIYKSGFLPARVRPVGAAGHPPAGATWRPDQTLQIGTPAESPPSSLPKCLGRETARNNLLKNPRIVSSSALYYL